MAHRETIILIHGTWAAPQTNVDQWYKPRDGSEVASCFTAKLNEALEQRGSSARCWAHCSSQMEIYAWSGNNSWVDRAVAARQLAGYVAQLQKSGWTCHLVAHSHGGNVALDALPLIASKVGSEGGINGNIVTIGTPFLDTYQYVSKLRSQYKKRNAIVLWGALALLWLLFILLENTIAPTSAVFALFDVLLKGGKISDLTAQKPFYDIVAPLLIFGGLTTVTLWAVFARIIGRKRYEFWQDVRKRGRFILSINSAKDEALQLLRHLRDLPNPLSPSLPLFRHLAATRRAQAQRFAEEAELRGEASLSSLSMVGRVFLAIIWLVTFASMSWLVVEMQDAPYLMRSKSQELQLLRFWEHYVRYEGSNCGSSQTALTPPQREACERRSRDWPFIGGPEPQFKKWALETVDGETRLARFKKREEMIDVILTISMTAAAGVIIVAVIAISGFIFGRTWISAYFSPLRGSRRFMKSLAYIPGAAISYFVRLRAWAIVQRLAYGLDGYRGRIPSADVVHSAASPHAQEYSELDQVALQHALDSRHNWIVRNFGDVSELLSKVTLNAGDISLLQRLIANDPDLVHGAYYSDRTCIEQIADWIASARI